MTNHDGFRFRHHRASRTSSTGEDPAAPRWTALSEADRVGLRWTIGDVWSRGFQALTLSIVGAYSVFGPRSKYAVYVNSVPLERVERCLAGLPAEIAGRVDVQDATRLLPGWLASRFGRGLAGGMGWKLAPVRAFPDRFELALDNDVVLWSLPEAVREWLDAADPCRGLVAGDVAGALH